MLGNKNKFCFYKMYYTYKFFFFHSKSVKSYGRYFYGRQNLLNSRVPRCRETPTMFFLMGDERPQCFFNGW